MEWQIKTRGLTRHLSQGDKEYLDAKLHFPRARNNFEGCADRWSKNEDCRKCRQEKPHSRHHENLGHAGFPRKTHNLTPRQRQAQFGNQLFKTAAGGTNTLPTREHPEFGEGHLAQMNYQSDQRATAWPSRKFLYASTATTKVIFTQNAIKNLAI